MAEIVNLRRHRKQKGRLEKERAAAENRARYGVTKLERDRQDALLEHDKRKLDGHRLGGDEEENER